MVNKLSSLKTNLKYIEILSTPSIDAKLEWI